MLDSTPTPTTAATAPDPGAARDPITQVATAAVLPFTVARQLLPTNPVALALGTGALAVAGVIEWPVAAAVGLGYLALRRWQRPSAGTSDTADPRPVPGAGR